MIIAALAQGDEARRCVSSLSGHAGGTPVLAVAPSVAAVNVALRESAAADAVVVLEPCLVAAGWLERLRAAALEDTAIATASALGDGGGPLALAAASREQPFDELAARVARDALGLRPRLRRAAGPCVYVRRSALELVGALDESLELREALELDLAQRCLLSGLSHVAADDVLVQPLSPSAAPGEPSRRLLERYPYLASATVAEAPAVLQRALAAAAGPAESLSVTIDARALDGAITGTHVHIVELVRVLAELRSLRLRVLVRERHIDAQTLALLSQLPGTELLFEERIDERTPASALFHRPQQAFSAEDVEVAMRLGERLVLSQLDMIAYANPGYFPDAHASEAYRRASRHGIAAAERVVVFSEHTRSELLADGLADPDRIRVVPPGLDHREQGDGQPPHALRAAEGQPYLLCLGTDFRHKNRPFALRMLVALRERLGWEGRLVLAGTHIEHGSSRGLEQQVLREHPEIAEHVLELGRVSEPERVWLVENAAAVVYPSVYEGFGLVPLEAGLSGVPCAFAAHSALAETAPAQAATILPWDPEQSAAALHALLTDPAARAEHVQLLAQAARSLRWEHTARSTAEVYREAAVAPVRDAATLGRDLVDRERELTAAHEQVVERLIGEREHARRMYDELNAEVGWGLSLIGPHGALPQDVQRTLLALAARPALSRPLFAAMRAGFLVARSCNRGLRRVFKRPVR